MNTLDSVWLLGIQEMASTETFCPLDTKMKNEKG